MVISTVCVILGGFDIACMLEELQIFRNLLEEGCSQSPALVQTFHLLLQKVRTEAAALNSPMWSILSISMGTDRCLEGSSPSAEAVLWRCVVRQGNECSGPNQASTVPLKLLQARELKVIAHLSAFLD